MIDIGTYKFYKKRALLGTGAAIVIAVPLLTVGSLVQMSYEGKLACIITGTALPLAFAFYASSALFRLQGYIDSAKTRKLSPQCEEEVKQIEKDHDIKFGALMPLILVFALYGIVNHAIEVNCGSYAANMGAKFGIGAGIAMAIILPVQLLLDSCISYKNSFIAAMDYKRSINPDKTSKIEALIVSSYLSISVGLATVAGPLLTDAIGITDAPAIIINLMFSGLCSLLLICAYETVELLRRPAPPEVQ